jgi:hypothetical protein
VQGRGRGEIREGVGHREVSIERSSAHAQRLEERVRDQQQKLGGEDAVMQEAEVGEVQGGDTAGVKCSRCTK